MIFMILDYLADKENAKTNHDYIRF